MTIAEYTEMLITNAENANAFVGKKFDREFIKWITFRELQDYIARMLYPHNDGNEEYTIREVADYLYKQAVKAVMLKGKTPKERIENSI